MNRSQALPCVSPDSAALKNLTCSQRVSAFKDSSALRRRRARYLSFLLLATPLAAASPAPDAEAEQLFVHRILPLFQEKCLSCHGKDEEKLKGGLDLRTLASAFEGGDSFAPSIVPGKPHESPLYLAATREHADWEPMPPKENDALTSQQIEYIEQWIAAGAPWPDAERATELLAQSDTWSANNGVPVKTSGGLDDGWTNRHYDPENLWAYQPLKKPAVPDVPTTGRHAQPDAQPARPRPGGPPSPTRRINPIDAFIDAALAKARLAPAPRADRRILIRRATFDLTGLPPTPEEIAAFLADPAPDAAAFATVVDRLLASPHYGEQMARHWLDVVRYADSSGLANDFGRANTWRYRDYVIRSFNSDKPYDHFVLEQIAGDEIVEAGSWERGRPARNSEAGETPALPSELLIATGFLRMGPWELTSMEVPRVARQKFLDDVTDSVGQVFLAHPLQCARCHDHKFDPISTKDYYSFQSIFATTQAAERPAAFLPAENTRGFEEKRYLEQRAAHYRRELARLDAKSIAAARAWYAERKLDPAPFEEALAETAGKGEKKKRGRDARYAGARSALMRKGIPEDQIPPKLAGFAPEDYGHERIARKGLERIRWELDRYEPVAFATYSGRTPEVKTVTAPQRLREDRLTAGELEQTHILTGGDPFANGAPVSPAVLTAATALGGMDSDLARVPSELVGRRAALANWIASPKNPLTARTYVNRLWLWHFGQAIAGNPNNFGATGKKPAHPELLDWLAATFVENGWSTKALHRLILSSDTYARASTHPEPKLVAERDPDGTRHAVFKPRRLAAEELRDAFLAVSGELNRTLGGIPARPEMNREAALQPRQVMGTFAEAWQPSPQPEQRHRRSLYALKLRGQLDPFMEVFNAPSPDLSCEARDASTVTPQVFAMFNSEATLNRAVAWAARLLRETRTPEHAVHRAFALAFGRPASAAEMSACLAHWDSMSRRHRTVAVMKPDVPREVMREAVEENTGEKFTFIEPLEVAADFVPDLHLADVTPETRGLAEVCLVLFNANEFAYVY